MKVVNLKKHHYTIYIGRGGPFGNPFMIGKDGSRKEVCEKYEEYARNNSRLLAQIYQLKEDDILGCFCKPLDCHGDIIVKLWNENKG